MKKIAHLFLVSLLLLPYPALAQSTVQRNGSKINSLSALVNLLLGLLNSVVPLLFSAAILFFLYNTYLFVAADPKTRASAKWGIVEALIGLFVMFSVYGLINVISQTFPLDNTTIPAPRL